MSTFEHYMLLEIRHGNLLGENQVGHEEYNRMRNIGTHNSLLGLAPLGRLPK